MSNICLVDVLEEEKGELFLKRSNIWANDGEAFSKTDERHELSDLKSTINPRLDKSK